MAPAEGLRISVISISQPDPLSLPFAERGERPDVASIGNLTAGFDIEAGLRQHDFDLVPCLGFGKSLAVCGQRQHRTLDLQPLIWVVLHPGFAQLAGLLEVFENPGVEFGILAAHLAHGLPAARGEAVFFHGGLKPASSTSRPCSRAMSRAISNGRP